jgi:hypothetical protein
MFFIPNNVPALKNGKIWSGKYLLKSKQVVKYLKSQDIKNYSSSKKIVEHYKNCITNYHFKNVAEQIKLELSKSNPPYKIGFHFVRNSKHKFDFGNAFELIADLFTAYDVWEDDNIDIFLPFPLEINGKYYSYDKNSPGVWIKILN